MSNVIVSNNLIAAITGGVFYTIPLARVAEGSQKLLVSPASILAAYIIETLGKMTDPDEMGDWPLYISHMPDGTKVKTNCGAIYNTTGLNEGRLMTGLVPTHPGIQLRIRSKTQEIGWLKVEDIASALDEVLNATVEMDEGEYEIQNVSRASPIIPLGQEVGTRRYLHTMNFLLTVKRLIV